MIGSIEALQIVMNHQVVQRTEIVDLAHYIGKVLAENIYADRDFPPFDRVTMDGIAIRFEAYAAGRRTFQKAGIAAAGDQQMKLVDSDHCLEVMTGAVLPIGADTVIRYEDLTDDGDMITVMADVREGQNVHAAASDAQESDLLLPSGAEINAMHINVLATVGKVKVQVVKGLSVAIIATGSELVDVDMVPKLHQIRMSNAHMIAARLDELDVDTKIYHLTDDKEILQDRISNILNAHDVLILSGGVSKGKYDYVPDVLNSIGVERKFHKVAQRPGKPMWFGSKGEKAVFALPGNPVSTFACLHRYFIPWYKQYLGLSSAPISVILSSDVVFAPALTYYAQARLEMIDGQVMATVAHGRGSGDMVHPTSMDGFLVLPAEKSSFLAGERYEFIPFRPII